MENSNGPLAGVRVLDVTQVIAGSYCAMLLADLGADVVKVEKPEGGDDTRRMGTATDLDASPYFVAMNRNKRGLAVDLKHPSGVALIRRLAETADVLVENFRPGTLDRLGLGYQDLAKIRPELVYCSVSGFGATGPYSQRGGFDLVAQAMSGLMSMTGEPDGAPVKVGVPICDLNAGMYAVYGVLAAYVHRLRTGQGQHVDTSLLEAGIAFTVWETAAYFDTGEIARPNGSAHRLSAPYELLPSSDGFLAVGAANDRTWQRLCSALQAEDLLNDARFRTNAERMRHRPELVGELAARMRARTTAEWIARLTEAGVPSGPMYDIAEVYSDPQVQARNMLVTTEHPRLGTVRHIGPPVKLSATPASVRRPAPLLGQHSVEILMEAGVPAVEIDALLDAGVLIATTALDDAAAEPATRAADSLDRAMGVPNHHVQPSR